MTVPNAPYFGLPDLLLQRALWSRAIRSAPFLAERRWTAWNRKGRSPVYVSVSRLRVEPDHSADLIAAFRSRAHLVEAFDGFEGIEVWQSSTDVSEVLMVSHWRDRAAFTDYMKSREHRISHDRINAMLAEAIVLERLEHLTGYEVVAR